MVGLFVRLKLRVLRSRLSTAGVLGAIGLVLVWLAGLGAGMAGMATLTLIPRLASDVAAPVAVASYFFVGLVWLVGPVIAASIDDTLDARRFELLPLGRTRLGIGLVAAAVVGPGGLATVIAVVGGSLAGFADPVSAIPILVTSVTACLLFIVTARWVLTALADLLRSRRTQEIAGLVIGLLMGIPGILAVIVNTGDVRGFGSAGDIIGVLVWTPQGALGRSVAAFAAGEWALGLAGLGYGLAGLVVVVYGYGRSLDRLQTTVAGGGGGRLVRGGGRSLRPKLVPLPSGPVGAVAAKELIYLRRDARVRSQLVGSFVGVVVVVTVAITSVDLGVYGPFLSAAVSFFLVVALVVNQFGYDGGSMWAYMIVAPDLRTVLKGKNVAWAVFIVPLLVLASFVGAVISADGRYLASAVLGSSAVLLIWMTVGNATSLFGPARIPDSNPFGNRGASGAAVVASLVGLATAGILNLPVILAVAVPAFFVGAGGATLGAVLSLAYAATLYVVSFRWIGPLASSRAHAVMDVIDSD